MKQLCKQMAGAAAILFILAACSENNSNYPEEYVGFDKTTKNYSFDRSKDVEEFDIKIIAAEKKKEDREVLINGVVCQDKQSYSVSRIKRLLFLQKRNLPICT